MNILERLDRQRGLTGQDPRAKFMVIYPKSASFLCAAIVRSKPITFPVGSHTVGAHGFLADYVTYFLETSDIDEARYLSAVLNSPVVDGRIKKDVRGPHAIGRARTAVREALKGELAEIDALVIDILK